MVYHFNKINWCNDNKIVIIIYLLIKSLKNILLLLFEWSAVSPDDYILMTVL